MVRLILIRHAQTDYNLQKRYCGFSNPPLNDKGIEQVKRLAKRLKGLKIDKIYSSDLKRAYQTAQIISKNNSVEKLTELREMNFGIFEGLSYQEIMSKYSRIYRKWLRSPQEIVIPEGESLIALTSRVRDILVEILSNNQGRTVAVVTHAGPISIILCDILKVSLDLIWQIKLEHAAIKIIKFIQGEGRILNGQNYIYPRRSKKRQKSICCEAG
jgi:alpha-ribazole phosphatase